MTVTQMTIPVANECRT